MRNRNSAVIYQVKVSLVNYLGLYRLRSMATTLFASVSMRSVRVDRPPSRQFDNRIAKF